MVGLRLVLGLELWLGLWLGVGLGLGLGLIRVGVTVRNWSRGEVRVWVI